MQLRSHQVAIKSSVDIFYFNVPWLQGKLAAVAGDGVSQATQQSQLLTAKVPYDLSAVLMDSGPVPKDDFQRVWQNQSVQKARAKRSRRAVFVE